ncbi:MAG: NAD-binding protein [Candidatus Heimdallarchaeaceae archaeon]
MLGGGILELELVYNISKQRVNVSVIEKNNYLLHKQLDEEGGLIFQKILEEP